MSRNTSSSAPSRSYSAASSTGSPASRRSRNCVPLTTRPASTSRHGMTRFRCMSRLRLARGSRRATAMVAFALLLGGLAPAAAPGAARLVALPTVEGAGPVVTASGATYWLAAGDDGIDRLMRVAPAADQASVVAELPSRFTGNPDNLL